MGRDDCMYALRRVFRKCNKDSDSDKWVSMEMKYRCVHYKAVVVKNKK